MTEMLARTNRFLSIAILAAGCANPVLVEGTVLDGAARKPLPGAEVTARGEAPPATTDAEGKYVLKGEKPGFWTLTAEKEGHLLVGEVVVRTAERETATPKPIVLLPYPTARGLQQVASDGYVAIANLPESKLGTEAESGNRTLLETDAAWLQIVPGRLDLVLVTDGAAPGAGEFSIVPMNYLPPVEEKGAVTLEGRWEIPATGAVRLAREELGKGLLRLRGDVDPGRYCARRMRPEGTEYWAFITLPPPAEIATGRDGARFLKSPLGSFDVRTDQWATARDFVLEWCREEGDRCSMAQLRSLEEEETEGNPACFGRLDVTADAVTFTSYSCPGGAVVDFSKQGDGWVPSGIMSIPH